MKTPTKPKKAAPKAAKEKSGAENDGQLAGASAAKTPSQAPSGPSTAATPGAADLLPPPGTLINPLTTFLPTTVTKAREFEATHGDTLTDTLQNKPGISGSTFAPGANRPIIRGLDNNRVRIQENGVTTGDVSDISEDHAIPIDPNSVDQVEVIRGPATLRYGSQAIGGVVSAENQRIPTFMPEHGATGKVNGGLSSVDDDRDGAINVTAGCRRLRRACRRVRSAGRRLRHAARHSARIPPSTATARRAVAPTCGATASPASPTSVSTVSMRSPASSRRK